jgi:ribosome-binding protein aMBF1 (putative translation factor)
VERPTRTVNPWNSTEVERYWFWTLLAAPRTIRRVEPKLKVGQNIRAERKRVGITQEALAERCDMHPVEVGRAERGVRDLRVSTVTKLARGLGIPAFELLRGVK